MPISDRRAYFHDKYPVESLFGSPLASGPMLLHIYEQREKHHAEIMDLLKTLVQQLSKDE